MAQRRGLGKGLGSLIVNTEAPTEEKPAQVEPPAGSYFAQIDVAAIDPNPKQPRQVFAEEELAELADSIKAVGLLQPIVVRKVGDRYQLIMGERRWRAHQQAGLATIGAIVRGTEDEDLLRDALLENLHRVQLNPLEEAAAYQQLLTEFGCTKEELAAKVQKSRPHISNTIRLLQLPAPVQRRVAAGVLSAGHARALLMLDDALRQEQLAQRIVAEGLSVRATEEAVTLALRDEPRRPLAARKARLTNPVLQVRASGLADRLDTSVKIAMGAKKGKITIDFADQDDLDRILALLNG